MTHPTSVSLGYNARDTTPPWGKRQLLMSTHLGCQEHIYKWPPTTKTKPSIASAPCVAAALPIQFGQKLPRPPRAYTHLAVQRTSSALRAAVQHPSSSAAEGHASIAMHLQTVAWYQFIQCRVKAPACGFTASAWYRPRRRMHGRRASHVCMGVRTPYCMYEGMDGQARHCHGGNMLYSHNAWHTETRAPRPMDPNHLAKQ